MKADMPLNKKSILNAFSYYKIVYFYLIFIFINIIFYVIIFQIFKF